MWVCAFCTQENEDERPLCSNCGVVKGDSAAAGGGVGAAAPAPPVRRYDFDENPASLGYLRTVGTVSLLAGLAAAVYWLTHIEKTVPGEYLPYTRVTLSDKKVIDPLAVGMAFASAFQGVVAYVLFSVVATIGEHVIAVRKQLADAARRD